MSCVTLEKFFPFLKLLHPFPHSVAAGTVAQVVQCTSESSWQNKWKLTPSPCASHQVSPLAWAEAQSGPEEKAPLLHLPKGAIMKDADSSRFLLQHIYSPCPTCHSDPKFHFSQICHILEHPVVCFVLLAVACPPIVPWETLLLGVPESAKALCSLPSLDSLSSQSHMLATQLLSVYVAGLDCAFHWGSISSFSFWVIWWQDAERDPFMSAALSSVFLAKLDL